MLETLQKLLTTFWATKTGWEVTSRLILWHLRQLQFPDEILCLFKAARVIVKGLLVSTMSLSSRSFLRFPPTVVIQTTTPPTPLLRFNCLKKCSYRSCLGRRMMLSITKQRKRENGETVNIVKAQLRNWPYMEPCWRNCLDKIHYWSRYNLRSSALVVFAYCKLFIFKIPASGTGF